MYQTRPMRGILKCGFETYFKSKIDQLPSQNDHLNIVHSCQKLTFLVNENNCKEPPAASVQPCL